MSSWFSGAKPRPHSINIGPRSVLKRQSIFERNPPEVLQFIQSVWALGKDEKPDKCVNLFLKDLVSIGDEKLKSYEISAEIGRVIRHLWFSIDEYLSDKEKASTIFQFLYSGLKIYTSQQRSDLSIFRIIIRIAHSKKQDLIEASTSFIQVSLQNPDLQKIFFTGNQLSHIWSNIFFNNQIACSILGPIFNHAASTFVVSEVASLEYFCQTVTNDIEKIDEGCAPTALLFVGYIIKSVNTGDFLPNILPPIREMALNLENFNFLEPFIFAPTSDPPAIWAAIDSICADPNLSIEQLDSALVAIYNSKQPPSSEVFSFSCIMPRVPEMNDAMVKMLFEVIQISEKESKADLFCLVMPLSQSGVNTTFLEKVAQGVVWGDDLLECILQKFFIEPGLDEVQLCLVSDEHVLNISKEFISQISSDSPSAAQLFEIFSSIANNGDDAILPLLTLLMTKANPEMYMKKLISQFSSEKISESCIHTYSSVCRQLDSFTPSFLAENGTELIPLLCESQENLEFLLSLVQNGPVQEIDDYIFEHFKELEISKFSREDLIRLMNGVTKDSIYPGYMRIPSLCAFIDNVPINTPYDQYIFGSIVAQKYVKPTKEQIGKFGTQYLSSELANECLNDPDILSAITNPIHNHHDIIQFNPSSLKCHTTIQRSTSISFWFCIYQVYGQTVMASFPGGSLIVEKNGYISFAGNLVYTSLKTWHLFSFVTAEKNNQSIIYGYLDGQKVGDIVTNKNMTITFGSTEANLNCAYWIMSPYLFMSNTQSDANELNNILSHRSHNPSNKIIPTKDIDFVPYKGILKYMHIYGGPSFIFNLLLEADDEEKFALLLQSAFNLYRLGCFSRARFFYSIRYLLRRKIEFWNAIIDQLLVHELEDKGVFNWSGFIMCINDYRILTSSQVQYKIILKVLNQYGAYVNDFVLFHTAIDIFIFMNYDEETENNIVQVIDLYINVQPALLKKLMMSILCLPFYDDENPQTNLLDDRVVDKQRKLFEIVMKSPKLFLSTYNPTDAFCLMALSGNGIAMDILYFISKLCISNNDYFDSVCFRQIVPFLFLHVKNEKLWISLLQFLTKKEGDNIDAFTMYTIARPIVLPHFIDLLTALIPLEIQNHSDKNLSFKVLHLLYSMVMSQNINLFGLIKNIQNLCSLGYGERTASAYPFQLSKKVVAQGRRSSRSKTFNIRATDTGGDHITSSYNIKKLADLDTNLYEDMVNYMTNAGQIKMDQFFEVEIPNVEDPQDFTAILETPIATFVTLLAVKLLSDLGNDSTQFKKSLTPLTIYGADVIPTVAIEMHKKVILTLLDSNPRLSNDNIYYLLDFLTHRIIEGWWNGKVTVLFNKMFAIIPGYHRNLTNFIIACLSQIQSVEDLISMGIDFLNFSDFKNLVQNSNENFVPSFLYLCVTHEIISSPDSTPLINLLAEKIEDQSFRTALNSNKLYEWVQNDDCASSYRELYQGINQNAAANSSAVSNERNEITRRSVNQKINAFMKTSVMKTTYIRKAFRFQFFSRVNEHCFKLEAAINTLFKVNSIIHYSKTVPTTFCRASSPHPLVVPFKLIPKLFEYDASYTQSKKDIRVPMSHHKPSSLGVSNISDLPEFAEGFTGPKCLEGWDLPQKTNYNVTSIFKRRFHASINPFNCSLLLAPEIFPCVACISYMPNSNANSSSSGNPTDSSTLGGNFDEKFNYFNVTTLHILMGAKVINGNIILIDNIQLCHFPTVENAMYGIYGDSSLFLSHVVLNIPLSLITMKVPRTYTYKPTALDIFTAYGAHFSLVTSSPNRKNIAELITLTTVPNARRSYQYALRLFAKTPDAVAKMWSSHIISNFDYLLYLNMMSGRSFNDYSQYPVFPWVISDYLSEDKPNELRDLNKPMGQMDPTRAQHYDIIYENTPAPKYFYGTHYSNPASVLHLLMRIEPSTLFNVVLHDGFDHPDRLFYSVEESWRSSSSMNAADLHELIPEMYCLPNIFENVNKIKFQTRSDGINIDNVILPKWAKDDPYEFIYQMRLALESPEVSAGLNNWIDLIFGYKQKGQAAVEAKNLFHPLSYQSYDTTSDEMETQAQIASILNFGQCPQQIFTEKKHIRRSKKYKDTLVSSEVRVCQIRRQPPNIVRIRYYEEDLYVCPKFSHALGIYPININVSKDGSFALNNHHITLNPVFDVTSSAQSSDNMYLTVATGSGMILNYYYKGSPVDASGATAILNEELSTFNDTGLGHNAFHGYGKTVGDEDYNIFTSSYNSVKSVFILISRSLLPGEHFITCAVSSHYGLVCAATEEIIYLFDLTSGFLLRRLEAMEPITNIAFDEVQGLIIVTTPKVIVVLSLDFTELALATADDYGFADVTSVSTCDGNLWINPPFFVTGHEDGSVFIWELILSESDDGKKMRKLAHFLLANVNNCPVTAICIVKNNKAIIAIDSEGNSCTITDENITKRIFKPNYYELCAICKMPFNTNNEIYADKNQNSVNSSSNSSLASNNSVPLVQQTQAQIPINYCANCGLPICRKCMGTNKPNLCKVCERIESIEKQHHKKYDRASSLSESDCGTTDLKTASSPSHPTKKFSGF